jgi:hypothetical protein
MTPLAFALGRGVRLPRARRPVPFTPAFKPSREGRGVIAATRAVGLFAGLAYPVLALDMPGRDSCFLASWYRACAQRVADHE